jgi:hypothetical protein
VKGTTTWHTRLLRGNKGTMGGIDMRHSMIQKQGPGKIHDKSCSNLTRLLVRKPEQGMRLS